MRSLRPPSDPCALADPCSVWPYTKIASQYQSSLVRIAESAPPAFQFRLRSLTRIGEVPLTRLLHPGTASASKMNIVRSSKPASPCAAWQKKQTVPVDLNVSLGRRCRIPSPACCSIKSLIPSSRPNPARITFLFVKENGLFKASREESISSQH
jgi:hypothetical protein